MDIFSVNPKSHFWEICHY